MFRLRFGDRLLAAVFAPPASRLLPDASVARLPCRAVSGALAGLLTLALAATPAGSAFAQSGGAGGNTTGLFGNGGASNATGTGGTGTDGSNVEGSGGGGGGGSGVTGGAGGIGFGGAAGGAGGTSGTPGGGTGENAPIITGDGGGGGGGGAHGAVVTTTSVNGGAINGGGGGAGGAGDAAGGGGGGGAGGYGVVLNAGGITYINTGTITGGTGGGGGDGRVAGAGGDGGYGLYSATPGATLNNTNTITGGTGGATGLGAFPVAGAGAAGVAGIGLTINNSGSITGGNGGAAGLGTGKAGGAGITGSNLIVTTSGAISGGLASDGVTQANAITFTGGTNTLLLENGFSFLGNVVAASTADTLALGGSTNDTFDVSAIGAQYQGFGGLQKTGTSTWTLTGTMTAATPWTVSQGTLAMGSQGSIASSSGVSVAAGATFDISGGGNQTIGDLTGALGSFVTLGGNTLTIVAANDDTFGGVIQGTGGISKSGLSALLLTQANTYTGATTISSGTLALTGSGSIAASSGVILSAAGANLDISDTSAGATVQSLTGVVGSTVSLGSQTLTVTPTGTDEFDGVFQDGGIGAGTGGGLTMSGSGTLLLTQTNTYTGATTVTSGTLALTGTGSIASSSGVALTASGANLDISDTTPGTTIQGLSGVAGSTVSLGSKTLTLDVPGNRSTIFGGVLQDGGIGGGTGGSLMMSGAGTLILTAANTYTGSTTISSGTLQLGNGGTGGSVIGNIADNGTLAFDRSDTVTFPGSISGSGAVAQNGSGTVILNGNSSSFGGSTAVNAGTLEIGDASHASAMLGGNVAVNPGGTLMGHGTIGGNVSNSGMVQPGGTIGIMTLAGNYAQSTTGTLTIEITPNATAGAGVGYSQLSVGGTASLAGTLAVLDDPGTYVVGSRYTVLTAAGGRSGTFATVSYNPMFAAYISPAISYDANDVYLTLDPTPSSTPAVAAPLFLGGQEVPDALTAMISAAEGVADTVLSDVCGAEARRLAKPGEGCDVRPLASGYQLEMWVRGLGGVGSLTGSGSRFSFSDDYGGVLLGAGISRGGFTVGAGGGYLATGLNFSDGSRASQNNGLGFVYGRYAQGPMWFAAMAAYGGGRVDGDRALPGTGLTAAGDRGGDFAVVQGRAAYDMAVGPVTVEPRATLAYIHAGQDAFAETGAGMLDLSYPDTNADTVEGRLTVRAMRRFAAGSWGVAPWVEGGVQQTFSGLSRGVLATDGAFSAGVAGVSPAPTAGVVGLGVSAMASDALDFFVRYQGQFSANQSENAFTGGVLMRF